MTMPPKAYNHSGHWRDRAAEMRALADCMEWRDNRDDAQACQRLR
jgi:hypothetical protein